MQGLWGQELAGVDWLGCHFCADICRVFRVLSLRRSGLHLLDLRRRGCVGHLQDPVLLSAIQVIQLQKGDFIDSRWVLGAVGAMLSRTVLILLWSYVQL